MSAESIFDAEELLPALRAIAEPTRLRILTFCAAADLSVTDLTELLNQSQPRISRHLKIMCEAEVLQRGREGTFAYYRVSSSGIGLALSHSILSMHRLSAADERALEQLKQKRHKMAAPLEAANAEQIRKLRSYYPSEKLIDQALSHILPEDRVKDLLDIGTGTGHMLALFGPRVTHAVGIDLSRDMLSLARANLMLSDLQNCRVQQADMYSLPLDSASFDAVTIHHVLHFAERPGDVIREAARVLRPGGRLVIVDFIKHDLQKLKSEFGHLWLGFDEAEIAEWCRDCGLEPEPPTILSEPGKQLRVMISLSILKSADKAARAGKKRKIAA